MELVRVTAAVCAMMWAALLAGTFAVNNLSLGMTVKALAILVAFVSVARCGR